MNYLARRVGLGLVVFASVSCSSPGSDNGDAGDAGGDVLTVGGCDPTKLPTQDTCVVSDAFGIFVSSSMGSASGDGTKAKPFASLQAGITAATTAKKRVYACAEGYAETITIADRVSMFGYFDCAQGWTVGTTHAKVQPATSPVATAAGIADPTRVEAFDFVAPNFTDQSQSSIGVIVSNSPALTITNATIHAGTGGKGASGTAGTSLSDSSTKNGGNSTQTFGACTLGSTSCAFQAVINTRAQAFGAGGTNACGGHAGGSGGNGGAGGEYSSNGTSWVAVSTYPTTGGSPNPATTQTAQGGIAGSSMFSGSPGQPGADGANGSDGASGGAVGTISVSGYAPADGTAGGDGKPGQGGGGSGAYGPWLSSSAPFASSYPSNGYGWGESGAGGGAGGCPGLAGQPGKGGGASIAIVAIQSNFVLDSVKLEASNGGDAGAAGAAGVPTSYAGGTGGASSSSATNKAGDGGKGGTAGLSGNGGGGPSIGLAYQGPEPTLTACTIAQGQGGAGVAQSPASPAGRSKDVYPF